MTITDNWNLEQDGNWVGSGTLHECFVTVYQGQWNGKRRYIITHRTYN